MPPPISGLHHVTVVSGDPQESLDFYAGVLGLRLVKRTVNFDDPGTYRLYFGDAAFYTYAYPEPDGFRTAAVEPEAAYYHGDLREFVLPYASVRTAPDPDAALLAFLQSTYDAAANLAGWDRAALERAA